LKAILDSYNDEDALDANFDRQKTQRIRELEKSLSEKEDQLSELQKADQKLRDETEILRTENAKLLKEISNYY
jgi:hypothetical protein